MNTDAESFEYIKFSQQMEIDFPKMFGKKYGGFACGAGWYPLIAHLCRTIQSHIDWQQKQGVDCPQVVVEQIKEKFGTLRFYYQGGDEYCRGVVSFAEDFTAVLCEDCGSPGLRRPGSWTRTLCDHHYQQREIERDRYAKDNGLEI